MTDSQPLLHSIEPDLLVASCKANGTVLFRNEAWAKALGSEADLWSNLLDVDAKIASQNFKEASTGSLVTHAVFMVRQSDRDLPLPVLMHFIPVPSASGKQSAGDRVVMITGEILAEPESWTENQTSKHRMETLGRMTMGIAHDFNNLLAGILGHIELMRAHARDDSSLADHLVTIEKAARGGSSLVNKIQRYIRQETQASFESIDLTALLQDCVALTRPYWYNEPRRQGISIELHCPPVDLPPIKGSPTDLRDVFVNLILNAVQALPEGGEISIDTAANKDKITVTMRDTGVGMAEHVLARIFEPLFTTKGGRGSGMGLAVASGIIQEHEGTIEAASSPGMGTVFTLTFPTAGRGRKKRRTEAKISDTRPVRVLVVDDEAMVRNVIDRLLSLRGHTVSAVESAFQGLELLAAGSFDVVISDQGMPEMSGREFARKIRGLYPTLPVILLTGDTDLSVDSRDIACVVTKPFQVTDLEEAIQSVTQAAESFANSNRAGRREG